MTQADIADGADPSDSAFAPTHLIQLSELPASEKEVYYDLLIAADAHFHRDYESGAVLADMRILGPGVKMPGTEEKKKEEEGPRLTPQEKLALQAAEAASVVLPGAITCASGDVFNYSRYSSMIKLIMGSKAQSSYKPKRRTLQWVMRLVHEIYDAR